MAARRTRSVDSAHPVATWAASRAGISLSESARLRPITAEVSSWTIEATGSGAAAAAVDDNARTVSNGRSIAAQRGSPPRERQVRVSSVVMWRQVALVALLGCGSSSQAKPVTTSVTPVAKPAVVEKPKPAAATEPPAPKSACDDVADLSIDGIIDEWRGTRVFARIGSPSDGAMELHCAWDGTTLALMADVKDDRVVRVRGGHEDHVRVTIAAGGKPIVIDVFPGNSMAKPKITKPAKVSAADSLQAKGFSVEISIPAAVIPEYSASSPQFELVATFHDSDAAAGGDETPLQIAQPIELHDRKDLLDDFLSTVRLSKTDIRVDELVDLDPDRAGKERLVAGGVAIGVLTDRFAFVTLPALPTKIELLPIGPKGTQIVAATVRQTGNGGARELLMLWTVWSGQLSPLVNIELKKELAGNVLESTWKVVKGKKGAELVVEPKPAIGFTAETYLEEPASDADSILLPWDSKRGGIAYTVKGAEIERRDLPPKKARPRTSIGR